jgi:hypothetical protein
MSGAYEVVPAGLGNAYRVTAGGARTASDLVRTSKLASTILKQTGRASSEWAQRFVIVKPAVTLTYFETENDAADAPAAPAATAAECSATSSAAFRSARSCSSILLWPSGPTATVEGMPDAALRLARNRTR